MYFKHYSVEFFAFMVQIIHAAIVCMHVTTVCLPRSCTVYVCGEVLNSWLWKLSFVLVY